MARPVSAHPLVAFGAERGWDYRRTAAYFSVPYSTFKQLAAGFTRASFNRAMAWQRRSRGKVQAAEVMAWQYKHAPTPEAEPEEAQRAAG